MFRLAALMAVAAVMVPAGNDLIREVRSEAVMVGGVRTPAFFRGYIYWFGLADADGSKVTLYTPDGHPAPPFATSNGTAQGLAADTDGTLAIAWGSGKAAGIDLRDASGALLKTIATGLYRPTHLAFGEDHSLWSFGWQLDAADPARADRSDYMTVRKYLPNGQEAGAYLPRSLFPAGLEPGMESWQRSNVLTIAHDRVGIWAYSGKSGSKTEWVELDLSGKLTGRWRLDQFYYDGRVALTSDGHVYVQNFDLEARVHRLHTLDRGTGTWQTVANAPDGWLNSADGTALVFSDFGLGPIHQHWYRHP